MLRIVMCFVLLWSAPLRADDRWVVYEGGAGPGAGKHIVLVSGDEEYRSEEALPQLGKILAKRHGFKCTVLFALDKDGFINPDISNIPGLEALNSADLMIIATRFRNLPDEQMKHLADYIESSKPILGLRTATHAFNGMKGTYAKYNNGSNVKGYEGGFGRQVLGERWVAHHGKHKFESTRGILEKSNASHPILKGIKDGDIWGPTDVYTANPPDDSTILVRGQVLVGMKKDDPPVEGKKNDPMMPVAWTRLYKTESGKSARVFCTTMGSSTDLESEGLRRLVVNAALWATGLESQIGDRTNVDLVGEYNATPYGFKSYKKGVRPADLK
jgi:type 1 glutamine amidotransferase